MISRLPHRNMALEVYQMCRTCLSAGSVLLESQSLNEPSETGAPSIADKLKLVTSITISNGDGLPSKICLPCFTELNRAFLFNVKCRDSDFTLRQYLKHHTNQEQNVPKDEPVAIECEQQRQSTEIVSDTKEEELPATCEEIDIRESPVEDDHVSLISADDRSAHDYNQNSVEDKELFSVTTGEVSNCAEETTDLVGKILVECGFCSLQFESNTFEDHSKLCSIKGDKDIGRNKSARGRPKGLYCVRCRTRFTSKKLMKHHMKSQKCGQRQFDCLVCKRFFKTSQEYRAHMKQHPIYICRQCGARFSTKTMSEAHVLLRKCENEDFECPACRHVFNLKRNLGRHMKLHPVFSCSKCEKTFPGGSLLKDHIDFKHVGYLRNQCSYCGKVLATLSYLKDHLKTHTGEEPSICPFCGKDYFTNSNLRPHLMRHTRIHRNSCSRCDYEFIKKTELKEHISKHTKDRPFVCNTCDARFTTFTSLVSHRGIHTCPGPYACDLCPMKFSVAAVLRNHRQTHPGGEPYHCKFCNRAYTKKQDFIAHLDAHNPERPYTCTICGDTFPKKGELKSHAKSKVCELSNACLP